jgi:hypothetical protein
MIIKAFIRSTSGKTGHVYVMCDQLSDFDFLITSDPYIQMLDFQISSNFEAIQNGASIIDAIAYRATNELAEHDRYPLAEMCGEEGQ